MSILISFTTLATFSQAKFTMSHYGSVLIECFYTVKISSSIPLGEQSKDMLKERISDMCTYMGTQLNSHRNVLINKLGETGIKDLEQQLKGYQQLAATLEDSETPEQKMSTSLWLSLSKSQVEKLFIKLNN